MKFEFNLSGKHTLSSIACTEKSCRWRDGYVLFGFFFKSTFTLAPEYHEFGNCEIIFSLLWKPAQSNHLKIYSRTDFLTPQLFFVLLRYTLKIWFQGFKFWASETTTCSFLSTIRQLIVSSLNMNFNVAKKFTVPSLFFSIDMSVNLWDLSNGFIKGMVNFVLNHVSY